VDFSRAALVSVMTYSYLRKDPPFDRIGLGRAEGLQIRGHAQA
jgi:hypothetical protein